MNHPGENNPAVSARGLRRAYTTAAGETVGLLGVTLRAEPGEWIALLGPNGSGKSTLLSIISTSAEPEEGELSIAGIEVYPRGASGARARARSAIGMVFQTPSLDGLLTIRENLRTAAALVGLRGAAAGERVEAALDALGLADRASDRVSTLSGGLKRRADLARALLGKPRVLILDEPTTGLDPDARRDLLNTLDRLRHPGSGVPPAVVQTTHLTEEADRADRVQFLDRGRLAAEGTPAELRNRVGSRAVTLETGGVEAGRTVLSGLGLEPREVAGRLIAPLDGRDAGAVAGMLDARGLTFTIGPPSLDDAYAAIVGRSLEHAGRGG